MALATPVHSVERYTCSPGAVAEALIGRLEQVLGLDQELHASGRRIYKEEEIYEAEILPEVQLWQLLYGTKNVLPRDLQALLQLAVDRSTTKSVEAPEIAAPHGELGPWHHNSGRELDDYRGWIPLLRLQLGMFAGTAEDFFEGCREAFPNFVFSNVFPKCLNTFEGDLKDFVPEVISALVSLSEDMPACIKLPSTKEALKAFSAVSGYETSMEGDAGRKDALTFRFINKTGMKSDIVCEPHIKLTASRRAGDNTYYYHRVYFSSRNHDDFPGKVFIGHIGQHL